MAKRRKRGLAAKQAKAPQMPSAEELSVAIGSVLGAERKGQADGLTPEGLGTLLKAADSGDAEAYLTLCEEMEERDPHYASVLGTRKMGVAGAPMSIETPSDASSDAKITDAVEALIEGDQFASLALDMLDGIAKGFSLVEVLWDTTGPLWTPSSYTHVAQRHVRFDKETLRTPRLITPEALDGIPLAPYRWIYFTPRVRSGVPIRTGLARTVAVCYAAKRFTVSDWLAFLDVYGMPHRVGTYPAHMKAQRTELLRAVQALGVDAAAVIPEGMKIEMVEGKSASGNGTLFHQSATYWDAQTSKLVLGQTMTADDGSSLAQAKTHDKVRSDIKKSDARQVAWAINKQLIEPFVIFNFGPQERYPSLRIDVSDPEDRTALIGAVKTFVDLGGQVQMSEIRDRLGFAEPEPGAVLLRPTTAGTQQPTQDASGTQDPGKDPGAAKSGAKDAQKGAAKDGAAKSDKSLNAATFARKRPLSADVVDDYRDEAISSWNEIADPVVGEAIRRVMAATSYEEAGAILDALKADTGVELDLGSVVGALSRCTFAMRGVGDATDDLGEHA